MAGDDFFVAVEPVEDLLGGGSRTRHIILKRRYASLSQSVFSCGIHEKIAPNRDYPYEGLCCLINGDYWKFIDVIALGLMMDGQWLTLKPGTVKVSPWACEYNYVVGDLTARATYTLYETSGGAGTLNVIVDGERAGRVTIALEPFFDIRFMYDPSVPAAHDARVLPDTLAVSVGDRTACLRAHGCEFVRNGRQVLWNYKLGSGFRCRKGDRLSFVPEKRTIVSPYEIRVEGHRASLRFACGGTLPGALELLDGPPRAADLERAEAIKKALFPRYVPRNRDVLFRAIGMDRFGMIVGGTQFPEAGDFWFKSVWFRDAFEGLIHSYQTIKRIDGTANIKEALLKAFDLQDDHGRVPNRLVPGTGESKPDYNSADATLLAFILAGHVVWDTNDGDLARCAAAAFRKFLNGSRRCQIEKNGPPKVQPDGLISVPAWHSWTDGMRQVAGRELPVRPSVAWEEELIARGEEQELFLQKFYLPEINAQWMRALEAGWLFCRYERDFALADKCKEFYNLAQESYKPVFLNPDTGFINNCVSTNDFALGRRVDPTPGSPGVVAAAMLGLDMFSLRELEGIAALARGRLMRTKWGMPFGIIVKDGGRETYLGDAEYHESVVWPRDTPYFIRLLSITGDASIVEGLLASNLRHQMEEGFVFYNQELFSCDHDLTPVKNPVQWWSQWVDPYLDRYGP